MTARILFTSTCFAALSLLAAAAQAPTTAFVGARIVDGTGKVIDRGAIVVRDGKIVDVGAATAVKIPEGATRVDLAGLTVIPGLINAHGHVTNVVGLQADKTVNPRENVVRQLKLYAQYGVTTVYSLGEDGEIAPAALQLRNEQATAPLDRARIFVSGPVITDTTADAARASADKVAAAKPDLLKIRVDDTLGSQKKMPEEAWRATVTRAGELKLPIATHIFYFADAKAALAAGSTIIAHSVRDMPVDAAFASALKAKNGCYIPTLMREVSTFVYGSTPPWTNDPFFVKGLGADASSITAQLADPKRQAGIQASGGYKQGLQYKAALETAKRNLKTLSDAGVRIAMGTDTGPPGRFQGFFEHLELEMMVEAGLTPMQTLVAATGDAAKCHGKAGQIGSIERGAFADFVVLKGNPLTDIKATRTIESVWISGRRIGS